MKTTIVQIKCDQCEKIIGEKFMFLQFSFGASSGWKALNSDGNIVAYTDGTRKYNSYSMGMDSKDKYPIKLRKSKLRRINHYCGAECFTKHVAQIITVLNGQEKEERMTQLKK